MVELLAALYDTGASGTAAGSSCVVGRPRAAKGSGRWIEAAGVADGNGGTTTGGACPVVEAVGAAVVGRRSCARGRVEERGSTSWARMGPVSPSAKLKAVAHCLVVIIAPSLCCWRS